MTLTLKLTKDLPHMTLQFMMMCHHTTFGYKRFSRSEDSTWANINLKF